MDFDSKQGRKQTREPAWISFQRRKCSEIPGDNSHSVGSGEWLRGSLRKRRCLGLVRESQAQRINSSTFLCNGTVREASIPTGNCSQRAGTQGMCAVLPRKMAPPTGNVCCASRENRKNKKPHCKGVTQPDGAWFQQFLCGRKACPDPEGWGQEAVGNHHSQYALLPRREGLLAVSTPSPRAAGLGGRDRSGSSTKMLGKTSKIKEPGASLFTAKPWPQVPHPRV